MEDDKKTCIFDKVCPITGETYLEKILGKQDPNEDEVESCLKEDYEEADEDEESLGMAALVLIKVLFSTQEKMKKHIIDTILVFLRTISMVHEKHPETAKEILRSFMETGAVSKDKAGRWNLELRDGKYEHGKPYPVPKDVFEAWEILENPDCSITCRILNKILCDVEEEKKEE